MEGIRNNNLNASVEEYLEGVKRELFWAHETNKKREDLLFKFINDLEWYLKIRKFLESPDRTDSNDLATEYFENKERYQKISEEYGLIDEKKQNRFTLREMELILQMVKTMSLPGPEDKLLND